MRKWHYHIGYQMPQHFYVSFKGILNQTVSSLQPRSVRLVLLGWLAGLGMWVWQKLLIFLCNDIIFLVFTCRFLYLYTFVSVHLAILQLIFCFTASYYFSFSHQMSDINFPLYVGIEIFIQIHWIWRWLYTCGSKISGNTVQTAIDCLRGEDFWLNPWQFEERAVSIVGLMHSG